MRLLSALLLFPFYALCQLNPAFVSKANLSYLSLQSSGDGMFGFENDGKFGYLDKSGNVVIPAIYSYASTAKVIPAFNKGYACVKSNDKIGFIDKTGKVVIPFQYDEMNFVPSFPAYAWGKLKENNKNFYGIISLQNKITIPIKYEGISMDSNLIAVQENGKWGLMDVTGKLLLPIEYTTLIPYARDKVCKAEKDGKYGFIDIKGNWLFEKVKSVYTLNGCNEAMILCQVNNKYGYLDLKGNEVTVTKYDYAYGFNKLGLAKVGKKSSSSSSTTLYGYIDKKGNEIIPVKYEYVGDFNNGLASAKDPETNRYGFLDKAGKWVLNPIYLDLLLFDEFGGTWVKQTDAKWHYINKSGKDLGMLDDKGTGYKSFSNNGYAVYENNDAAFVLLDKNGTTVKKLDDLDAIYNFNYGVGGYKCKSNGKYGFIDVNGNKITSCELDGFDGFTEGGISKVTKTIDGKNKSGYMDAKGNVVLPIAYDYVYNFRDGWGLIYRDGRYYFVDKNGSLKDPPAKYDELYEFRSGFSMAKIKGTGTDPHKFIYINKDLKEEFTISAKQAYAFWEDVAIISRDNTTYEMMDKKGNIFKTLPGIETLSFCVDGMLAVRKNLKWGYINNKGDEILAPKYDTCTAFKYGYGRVKLNSKWGIVDRSGTEIIPPKYTNILPGENGYFIYYDTNGWGMMDKTGKVIIQPTLSSITPFEKDRAMARLGKTYTIIKSPLAK